MSAAAPSHLGHAAAPAAQEEDPTLVVLARPVAWSGEAEKELRKIPFFVRGKARRNTERFAAERGLQTITIETLYDAKAHYSR